MFIPASHASFAASAPQERAPIKALVGSGAINHSWPFGKAYKGRIALQDHGDDLAQCNLRIEKL